MRPSCFRRAFVTLSLGAAAVSTWASSATEAPRLQGLRLSGTSFHAVPLAESLGPTELARSTAVAILESAVWSPNDPIRDGAREFEIFLTVAGLVREQPLVGLVGVGNRAGLMRPEAERALRRVALMGVPVVKAAAPLGNAEVDSDNLFIEAGNLTATQCQVVLAECLTRYGALTPAIDPSSPTEAELQTLRHQLGQYQLSFAAADDSRAVASR